MREILVEIQNNKLDVQLGAGWPANAEAVDETNFLVKGLANIRRKLHRPHHQFKEHNKTYEKMNL